MSAMLILKLKRSLKNLTYHSPVLLQVACDFLAIKPGEKYIDATYGGGGHTAEIKNRGGKVLTIDQDPDAGADIVDNFVNLAEISHNNNWYPVAGVLFDLGVSMHQFTTPERGFSIDHAGPLDMRMGRSAVTAAAIVNSWPVEQLSKLFADYGEIPVAKLLAQKIIAARPLTTTSELTTISGKWSRQVFQALRIVVNEELEAIASALPQALALLQPGGRIVVISFHSLEDRIVKDQFKKWEKQGFGKILTAKPVDGEKKSKLRAFEKLSI